MFVGALNESQKKIHTRIQCVALERGNAKKVATSF
jgi:hypothetical protein